MKTSTSRAVSSPKPGGGATAVAARANSWMSRRVMDGASSAGGTCDRIAGHRELDGLPGDPRAAHERVEYGERGLRRPAVVVLAEQLAAVLPARHASRIDVLTALAYE